MVPGPAAQCSVVTVIVARLVEAVTVMVVVAAPQSDSPHPTIHTVSVTQSNTQTTDTAVTADTTDTMVTPYLCVTAC